MDFPDTSEWLPKSRGSYITLTHDHGVTIEVDDDEDDNFNFDLDELEDCLTALENSTFDDSSSSSSSSSSSPLASSWSTKKPSPTKGPAPTPTTPDLRRLSTRPEYHFDSALELPPGWDTSGLLEEENQVNTSALSSSSPALPVAKKAPPPRPPVPGSSATSSSLSSSSSSLASKSYESIPKPPPKPLNTSSSPVVRHGGTFAGGAAPGYGSQPSINHLNGFDTSKPLPPPPGSRNASKTVSTSSSAPAISRADAEDKNKSAESSGKSQPQGDVSGPVAFPGAAQSVKQTTMLWSWLSRAVGVVLDKQAQESLEHTLRLLNNLFLDRDSKRSFDALICLLVVATYYKSNFIRSGVIEDNPLIIKDATHYFKFSAAAYGWKMLNPLMFSDKKANVLAKGFAKGDAINNAALCQHTGIENNDIIACKWTSYDYNPAHFIAVDHATHAIVVSIRGTFHLKDALADLVASACDFQGGFAHTGMVQCAERKLKQVQTILESALRDHAGYKLIVVGHSLGAGTASLLTLMLHEKMPDVPIHCFAYAPPCVLSPNLAMTCEHLITSFCLGDDCVPRLSYGSLFRLKRLTSKLMKKGYGKKKFLASALSAAIGRPSDDADAINSSFAEIDREMGFSLDDKLLPPGRMYHIIPQRQTSSPTSATSSSAGSPLSQSTLSSSLSSSSSSSSSSSVSFEEDKAFPGPSDAPAPAPPSKKGGKSKRVKVTPQNNRYSIVKPVKGAGEEDEKEKFVIEKSNVTFFGDVIVSSTMFTDHLPWRYHEAFAFIRDSATTKFSSSVRATMFVASDPK